MKRRESAAFKRLRDECLDMIDKLAALRAAPTLTAADRARHAKWLTALQTVAAGTSLTHPLARDVLEARSYLSAFNPESQATPGQP